jgi:hypothetical protein
MVGADVCEVHLTVRTSAAALSPIDYECLHAANPDRHQSAAVLAAVKDKPSGRPRHLFAASGAAVDAVFGGLAEAPETR